MSGLLLRKGYTEMVQKVFIWFLSAPLDYENTIYNVVLQTSVTNQVTKKVCYRILLPSYKIIDHKVTTATMAINQTFFA